MIFIIGCGRSGTNWLARSLGNSQDITITIEDKKIFNLSSDISIMGEFYKYDELCKCYREKIKECKTKYYIDKSHQNLWIAEKLLNTFPESKFISIVRNPYETVSSMVRHKGVLSWFDMYEKGEPIYNKFLGVNLVGPENYNNLSLIEKCALRWSSHYNEVVELKNILSDKLLVVNYENFYMHPYNVELMLNNFLHLDSIKAEAPKPNSFKSDSLTKKEYKEIKSIIGESW